MLQVHPIHELHDDEVGAVCQPEVEDLDAVGVAEVEAELRLVEEHADKPLVLREFRGYER